MTFIENQFKMYFRLCCRKILKEKHSSSITLNPYLDILKLKLFQSLYAMKRIQKLVPYVPPGTPIWRPGWLVRKFDLNPLTGPSQPHLCLCLHARIWLLYFIWSLSKWRKITVKLLKIIKHTLRITACSKIIRICFIMLYQ